MKKAPLPPPCVPSQQTNGTIQNCEQMASPHPGDDCAINELLEGTMDLEIVLPDARRVRMTIERRMPMMDLLVQATTANKISPGGHVIALSPEGDRDNLRYKPNTPIGSLDTNTVYIMSKSAINDPPAKKVSRSQLQPFEPTFRLQVNLPRNQLMVMRVSPKTTLAEIKKMVCAEKGFDSTRYHLVHPTQPNYLVDLNCKLSDYGGTEISLMSDLNVTVSIRNSTSDLIGYAGGEDEKRRKKLLGIFKRKSKSVNNMMIAGDAFKDTASSRGISPARSDICDTRSLRTKRQSTKKRPPPPPPVVPSPNTENSTTSEVPAIVTNTTSPTTITTTTVSHSRQSSDSSGYHEASVLSDCPDNLSPETSSGCAGIAESPVQHYSSTKRSSRTPTREKPNFSSVAHSTMLIISTSKKRRAPPPPPLDTNKGKGKIQNETDCTANKDNLSEPVNGESVNSANATNTKKTENLSAIEPVSPDSLPTSPAISESNASCSPPTSPVCNDTFSSESSPVSSPSLPADTTTEAQTPNGNVSNHCHTEEETGEVIHLLEKGADISDISSVIEDELLHEFIPPPLEFATPIPPPEYNGCEEEKSPQLPVHTISYLQDSTKMKSTPIPQPRLTRKISSQLNKACRRSLNFSDVTDQKSKQNVDVSISAQDDISMSEIPKNESQDAAEVKTGEVCSEEQNDEDADGISSEILPLNEEDALCVEDEDAVMDDVEWDFSIPEPPLPFRNSADSFQPPVTSEKEIAFEEIKTDAKDYDDSVGSTINEKHYTSCCKTLDDVREKSLSVSSVESPTPPLPLSYPPREEVYRSGSVSSDIAPPLPISEPPSLLSSESNVLNVNNETPIIRSGFNKSINENGGNTVCSASTDNDTPELLESKMKNGVTSFIENGNETGESTSNRMFVVAPQPQRRAHLQNFTIGSYKNETSIEIVPWGSPDHLREEKSINIDGFNIQKHEGSNKKSLSKHDYVNVPYNNRNICKEDNQGEYVGIKDEVMASPLKSQEEDHITERDQIPCSMKKGESTKIEEERLQEEYRKLQNQLIAWQQQLAKNQTLLQQKQIVSNMNVPIISSISSEPEYTEQQTTVYKSQTLPRTKPTVTKESDETVKRYSTVEYHSSSKPQVLTNVTIGSWKSKSKDVFSSNPVTDTKPKFQTLAPIISLPQRNARRSDDINLLKSSKSSHISATFDVKPSQTHEEPENSSSSAEKTEGNPALILAQIRNEIKASSRHPAGISVSSTDANYDPSGFQNSSTKQSTKVSIKSKPHVTYSYFGNPSTSSRSISQTMVSHTKNEIAGNTKSDSGETKPVVIASIKSRNSWGPIGFQNKDSNIKSRNSWGPIGFQNKDSNKAEIPFSQKASSSPPPAPPLPPVTVPLVKDNNKLSDSQIKISRTDSPSDPREELMIEIRKFGGRTALRKVPHNQAGWHLKVFGTLSSTPV